MSLFYIVMAWRIWIVVAAVLFLNPLASFAFGPSKTSFCNLLKSLPFILIWPLAVFAPAGRAVLFKRFQQL
jgi:hypothetical protein